MTTFLRLLDVPVGDKPSVLREAARTGDTREFIVMPEAFAQVPGSPFAYWVSDNVRRAFVELDAFQGGGRVAASGGKTLDDFRFIRTAWEIPEKSTTEWPGFAKGGAFSPFYADVFLRLHWVNDARALKSYLSNYRESRGWSPQWTAELHGSDHYFRPGLTWPRRTNGLSFRAMPAGCIFADKGPAAFFEGDEPSDLLALCSLVNSQPFGYLVSVQLARTELAQSYEVGLIQQTPVPDLSAEDREAFALAARRAWLLRRMLDSVNETSHAFLLPAALRDRDGLFKPAAIDAELEGIRHKINALAFLAYNFDDQDRAATVTWAASQMPTPTDVSEPAAGYVNEAVEDSNEADGADTEENFYSWAVGVAFGRFDLRLATRERQPPPEPEPFDPLPTRSPGMIPEVDAAKIPTYAVLVDDLGQAHDLPAKVSSVIDRLGVVKSERIEKLRRWLAREFFPLHIRMYSRSRRKAPIYWQLATPSSSYSVWLYIHAFTRDTLYKVQNEYVAPKLAHEERKLESLRSETGTSPKATQRKELEVQESFVEELRAFLAEVQRVAPLWNPDLDDGVIINFAPLWRLVPQHKSWQKELKATWDALCVGDYDWAHLAMHLWPERVVPKCATDRSLAIAHGLEEVFWEEGEKEKWKARSTPTRPLKELVEERTSQAVKTALQSLLEAPTVKTSGGKGRVGRKRKDAGGEA